MNSSLLAPLANVECAIDEPSPKPGPSPRKRRSIRPDPSPVPMSALLPVRKHDLARSENILYRSIDRFNLPHWAFLNACDFWYLKPPYDSYMEWSFSAIPSRTNGKSPENIFWEQCSRDRVVCEVLNQHPKATRPIYVEATTGNPLG